MLHLRHRLNGTLETVELSIRHLLDTRTSQVTRIDSAAIALRHEGGAGYGRDEADDRNRNGNRKPPLPRLAIRDPRDERDERREAPDRRKVQRDDRS